MGRKGLLDEQGGSVLSMRINKYLFYYSFMKISDLKKKKNTYTYQTYNYVFSHFKICCMKYGTKHLIFLIISIINTCFHNAF